MTWWAWALTAPLGLLLADRAGVAGNGLRAVLGGWGALLLLGGRLLDDLRAGRGQQPQLGAAHHGAGAAAAGPRAQPAMAGRALGRGAGRGELAARAARALKRPVAALGPGAAGRRPRRGTRRDRSGHRPGRGGQPWRGRPRRGPDADGADRVRGRAAGVRRGGLAARLAMGARGGRADARRGIGGGSWLACAGAGRHRRRHGAGGGAERPPAARRPPGLQRGRRRLGMAGTARLGLLVEPARHRADRSGGWRPGLWDRRSGPRRPARPRLGDPDRAAGRERDHGRAHRRRQPRGCRWRAVRPARAGRRRRMGPAGRGGWAGRQAARPARAAARRRPARLRRIPGPAGRRPDATGTLAAAVDGRRSLLAAGLLVIGLQAAAGSLVLARPGLGRLAPPLACGAWLELTAEAIGGDPQWLTIPVGLTLLAVVEMTRAQHRRARKPFAPELRLLEHAGMLLVVGAALAQTVTRTTSYGLLAPFSAPQAGM